MFNNDDKRKIYWIIDEYINGKILAKKFCDEFYFSYDLELDIEGLNELEKDVFLELSHVVGRFSNFKEDIAKYPKVYFSEAQLLQKVIETKQRLNR